MNAPFRALAAFMATLLVSQPVFALTKYNIAWTDTQFHNGLYDSCATARLEYEGIPFFQVNRQDVPTYTESRVTIYTGDDRLTANAPFDSSLLAVGQNDFLFRVATANGADACTHSQDVAVLTSPITSPKPLFNIERHGTSFSGNSTLDLSLLEINPGLAKSLETLNKAIDGQRKTLVSQAADVQGLSGKLDALAALQSELNDLVQRPLDEIGSEDLDAILARYASIIDPVTKGALESLLADLKRSVADLRQELDRLLVAFREQAAVAEDLVTKAARQEGWNPEDPANYTVSQVDLPAVDVPDLSTTYQPYDAGTDPYATYAQRVLDRLSQLVRDGNVVVPVDFLGEVRAARRNFQAMEEALRKRAVLSRAETAAFTAAQNRVTGFIRSYMDERDWLKNNPVPQRVRDYVDGVLLRQFPTLTPGLKDALNLLQAANQSAKTDMLVLSVDALGAGATGVADDPFDDVEQFAADYQARVGGAIAQATTMLKIAVGGLAGLAPGTGDAIDVCETLTGREGCDDTRPPTLSVWERAASGLGWLAGSAKMWRAVGSTMGGAVLGVISQIEKRANELRGLTRSERAIFKARFGKSALTALNGFDGAAMTALGKRFPDSFIARYAPTMTGDGMREFLAHSYLKIFDKKSFEIARDFGGAVKALPPFEGKSVKEVQAILSHTPGWQKLPTSTVDQEFWGHADRSLVRIAFKGSTERPYLHMKKEIGEVALSSDFGVGVAKLTDDGIVVPAGSNTVRDQVKTWYRKLAEKRFGGNAVISAPLSPAQENELIEVGWGDATHIKLSQ
jgi:hypothetical protein